MPYSQMLYGAVLSAALAAVLIAVLGRTRQPAILLAAALSAFVMPLAWNLILRTTGATGSFSHDLPFKPSRSAGRTPAAVSSHSPGRRWCWHWVPEETARRGGSWLCRC